MRMTGLTGGSFMTLFYPHEWPPNGHCHFFNGENDDLMISGRYSLGSGLPTTQRSPGVTWWVSRILEACWISTGHPMLVHSQMVEAPKLGRCARDAKRGWTSMAMKGSQKTACTQGFRMFFDPFLIHFVLTHRYLNTWVGLSGFVQVLLLLMLF